MVLVVEVRAEHGGVGGAHFVSQYDLAFGIVFNVGECDCLCWQRQSVVATVMQEEGIVVDEGKRQEYVKGLVEAINKDDDAGLKELVEELSADSEMKIAVWANLPSVVRSYIKKMSK